MARRSKFGPRSRIQTPPRTHRPTSDRGADALVGDGSPQEVDPLALQQAFLRVEPMIRAISAAALIPIRMDIPTIAMSLIGRLRAIGPYRETIASLPLVRQDWLGNLEFIALALLHVDSLSKVAAKEAPTVRAIFDEGSRLRNRLRGPVLVLEKAGLIPSGSLAKREGKRGYVQTAQDLLLIGNVLRDSWELINGRTTITLHEVNRCNVLAQLLFRHAKDRNKRTTIPADLALLRQRAYTLFLFAYDELRRCLAFIERGLEDELAPTLYEGRGRRASKGS